MNVAVRQIILDRGLRDPVSAIMRKYRAQGASGFLLGDPNPGLRTDSLLSRSYQDFAGTVADTSTQTVALGLDLSEGAAIGANEVSTDFTQWSNFIDVSGNATRAETTLHFEDPVDRVIDQPWSGVTTIPAGVVVEIRVTLSGNGACRVFMLNGDGSTANVFGTVTLTGTPTEYATLRPNLVSGTNLGIGIYGGPATSGGSPAEITASVALTFRLVAGNHFYQATSADEPTLTYANSQWGYIGDGTSKHFKTGLVGAAAGTFIVAMNYTGSLSVTPIGCETGVSRIRFDMNNTNTMKGYVGSTTSFEISSGSVKNTPGIAALRWSGSSVYGLWKPIGGSTETASGSFSGSVPTTQSIYLAGNNDDGTANKFFQGTIYRALAQQSAYTDAEIAAIANQWSRELASLAA